MIVKGRFNKAVVYADWLDETSKAQIETLLDQQAFSSSKIRIMPDVHAGAGCVIGLSMDYSDKVVPNLVGVDIGCGVLTLVLKDRLIDFDKLDQAIRNHIPSGFNVHPATTPELRKKAKELGVDRVHARVDQERAVRSLGTLGGGNHFIEVGRGQGDELYLFIHSGSRRFGYQIAEYHQAEASKRSLSGVPKSLAYLEGEPLRKYLHDMEIAQRYARENRRVMAEALVKSMNLNVSETFDTVHNVISTEERMIRKGAVPARLNEKLVIPLNMRDGVLIAKGKGNPEWNQTAPHGAGRLYSRKQAKKKFSMEAFKQSMKHVYTTSLRKQTLDEAPMAYKDVASILPYLHETVDIIDKVTPLYNFKA